MHGQLARKRMWLPASIYERIPQFYFLSGLLFVADGLYLGFEYWFAIYYIGLGMTCSVYGASLYLIRKMYRRARPAVDENASPADASAPGSPAVGNESIA